MTPGAATCPGCPAGDFCGTQWSYDAASARVTSVMPGSGALCLTAGALGQPLSVQPCSSDVSGGAAAAQTWAFGGDGALRDAAGGNCASLGGASSVNVWGRPLADGGFALAAANMGLDFAAFGVVCDYASCLGPASGFEPGQALAVRDVLAHAWLANTTAAAGWAAPELPAGGGVAAVVLTPIWP